MLEAALYDQHEHGEDPEEEDPEEDSEGVEKPAEPEELEKRCACT